MDILRFILDMLTKFADKFGMGVTIIILGVFGFFKICNNHLAHLKSDIKEVSNKLTAMDTKVDKEFQEIKTEFRKLDKKVAIRDEICEERHK